MTTRVTNTTKTSVPRIDFDAIKVAALGTKYDLSVVIAKSAEMMRLNAMYRGRKTSTDILSFPLSKDQGEIYICPKQTRLEAKKFHRSYENFFAYLYIHGCTHLKGHEHGATMERLERRLRRKFKI